MRPSPQKPPLDENRENRMQTLAVALAWECGTSQFSGGSAARILLLVNWLGEV